MKLWLDDERDPKDPLIQHQFGANGDEIWVKTPYDAIRLLETHQVTSISLDHDLGLGKDENGKEINGQTVSQWILDHALNHNLPPIEWYTHTQNPTGAKWMRHDMKMADRHWYKMP